MKRIRCLAAAVLTLTFAACGGGDTGGNKDSAAERPRAAEGRPVANIAHAVDVAARDISYSQTSFSAPVGPVKITLRDEGALNHSLILEGVVGFEKLMVAASGEQAERVVDLAAGNYVFFCDVPGHRGLGMEGTITVGG